MGLSYNLRMKPKPSPMELLSSGKEESKEQPGLEHTNRALPVQLLALSVLFLLVFCLQSLECLNILNRFKCIVEVFNYVCNKGLNIFLQKNKTGFQPQTGTGRSLENF